MIDKEKIAYHIQGLIEALGDDINREGLKQTPQRVANMYEEVFEGMNYTNQEIARMFDKTFEDDLDFHNEEIIVIKDIDIFSYCEHHLALMYDMKVNVAYIPKDKIIGLSKVSRIVDMVSKRLQLQERIASDIIEVMKIVTGSDDIGVYIEGKHSCMSARGIKKANSVTSSIHLSGRFQEEPHLQIYLR